MSYYSAVRSLPEQPASLSSADVALDVRQHPQNALVTPENKEKTRKPIDPPPIVQLKVNGNRHRDWLVNPFLFMNAVLVGAEDEHGQPKTLLGNQLLGQNVSSLHRLKDINNKDGGFFVFGDISCRKVGVYRLQFNLFNYERDEVNFLGSVVSHPFRVMTAKEYPGLQESTHLSRTFSDQGVRLRLRKENRSGGVKRTYTTASEVSDPHQARPNSSMYSGGPVHNYSYEQPDRAQIKRQRSESEYTSPHAYAAYTGGAIPQYNMPGQSMYAQPHSQHPEQQKQVGSMMTSMQQNMMSNWQRSPAAYSASAGGAVGLGGGSYFGSGSSSGQMPRHQNYAQPTSPQYGGRGSTDVYAGMSSSLPTPVSDQGLGSTQPSMAGYGQPGQIGAALPSGGQPVQQYDLAHPSSQYAHQPVAYHQAGQPYQTTASNPMYDQHHTPNPAKHEDAGYRDPPNMYNAPTQTTYAGAETFSTADNPLSTGMLNREFSGAYQQQPPPTPQQQEPGGGSGYAEMTPGQDLSGYQQPKSQPPPAAYPTPQHQTSPTH